MWRSSHVAIAGLPCVVHRIPDLASEGRTSPRARTAQRTPGPTLLALTIISTPSKRPTDTLQSPLCLRTGVQQAVPLVPTTHQLATADSSFQCCPHAQRTLYLHRLTLARSSTLSVLTTSTYLRLPLLFCALTSRHVCSACVRSATRLLSARLLRARVFSRPAGTPTPRGRGPRLRRGAQTKGSFADGGSYTV